MTVRGLDHVSLSVKSLERSIAFYHGLLEIPILGQGEESIPELAEWLGVPSARFRFADLDLGERGILELLQYLEPTGAEVVRRPFDRGISHFGITVADLDTALKRLGENGHEIVGTPAALTEPKWWAHTRTIYLRDPDGIVVELVERSED